MTPTFNQNIIALVWDFDKTLIPYYMQKPLFEFYNIDESQFWAEVNQLPALYKAQGITLSPDTAYLNHILTYVKQGKFKNLSNQKLRELGSQLEMFHGLPNFFQTCRDLIEKNSDYQKFNLKVEHYVVSTGLTEMIKGSSINQYIDGIWGCEFIEDFYVSENSQLILNKEKQINNIAYLIDNTTKTRALFEINKGVNVHPEEISVNQSMPEKERRVPFENMIYIADGPSDIPAFSVMKKNKGKAFAVYNKEHAKSFKQAKKLVDDNRVDNCFAADYREASDAFLWLTNEVIDIADRILSNKKSQLRQGKNSVPLHIN